MFGVEGGALECSKTRSVSRRVITSKETFIHKKMKRSVIVSDLIVTPIC